MQLGQGVGGVGLPAPVDLEPAGLQARDVAHRRLHQSQPVLGRAHGPLAGLLPGHVGHHQHDPVEAQGVLGVDRRHQMADVDRIERAPEDPDPLAHDRARDDSGDRPTALLSAPAFRHAGRPWTGSWTPEQVAGSARPSSSRTGPTARPRADAQDPLRPAPAGVRRRGPEPAAGPGRGGGRARPSCCRPATAPSRSTTSPPTASGTSSRSSCRWPSCSPTAPACRSSSWAASPASSPSPARRRPRSSTAGSCRASGATSSTTTPRPRRPAPPTRPGCSPPTTSRRRRSTCCGPSPRAASPTCRRSTPGTSSSWPAARAASTTRPWPAEIDRALRFMRACGINLGGEASLQQVDFWTSHEALILGFEEAMTRRDSLTGDWYDTSAHLVWVGERTRRLDGAHLDFLSGLSNPVAAKIGPDGHRRTRWSALCAGLDPDRTPGPADADHPAGRRAGRRPLLPPLLRAVRAGRPPGGVGVRPHARQHLHRGGRAQDPPLRPRADRDPGVLRRLPGRGGLAGRGPRRADRRQRHRVPGRDRRGARGPPRAALHHHLRPPPQRQPVARPGLPGGRPAAQAEPHRGGAVAASTAGRLQYGAHGGIFKSRKS